MPGVASGDRDSTFTVIPMQFFRSGPVLTGTRQGLRAYAGTAILLLVGGAAALTTLLPIAGLSSGASPFRSRLGLPSAGVADYGIGWSGQAVTPAALQHAGIVTLFQLLLGIGAALLVVGWLTTLGVSAARASARRSEVNIRRSVGASRRVLVGTFLAEGVVIAGAALVIGGLAGWGSGSLLARAWPGSFAAGGAVLPVVATLAVTGAVALGALLPLAYAGRRAPLQQVGGEPLGLAMPVLQLGVSLTVLVAAALLWKGASRLTAADEGDGHAYVFRVSAARDSAPAERSRGYAALLRHVAHLAGVESAALVNGGGVTGAGVSDFTLAYCGEGCSLGGLPAPRQSVRAMHYLVTADSFRALGLPIVAGRGIADTDDWSAPRVALVNRSFAARHFQDGDPLGHWVQVGSGPWNTYTVVGVVEDREPDGVGGALAPPSAVYLSVLQQPAPVVDLLVRGSDATALAPAVADGARAALGPRSAVGPAATTAELRAVESGPLRWFAGLFGLEGWALLVIATLGTAVVTRQWIDSLATEFGVRRSVGATRRQIMVFVLLRMLAVAGVGTLIGLWFGSGVWATLRDIVAGVPVWDGGLVLRIALLLAAAVLIGALPAAWRSARALPAQLLGSS
jgi:hypothetical protein